MATTRTSPSMCSVRSSERFSRFSQARLPRWSCENSTSALHLGPDLLWMTMRSAGPRERRKLVRSSSLRSCTFQSSISTRSALIVGMDSVTCAFGFGFGAAYAAPPPPLGVSDMDRCSDTLPTGAKPSGVPGAMLDGMLAGAGPGYAMSYARASSCSRPA